MIEPPPVPLSISLFVVLTLSALALGVLSALIERSGPIRLRHWVEKSSAGLRALYDHPQRFEAFRFLMSVSARCAVIAMAWSSWNLARLFGSESNAVWIGLGATLAVLLLVEWINRMLVVLHSETALRRASGALQICAGLLTPLIRILAPLVPHEAFYDDEEDEDDEASDDEIDAYIDVGRREGILEPEEEVLVRSIVDFGDAQVRSVMTPRVEMKCGRVDDSPEDLARLFFETKHSRIPLYRDSIDEVLGILHIRDLFEALQTNGSEIDVARLSNAPFYVPESKRLRQLLEEMQEGRQQMAIVVDEYGGIAGLVTVEDLLEEIVGDIADEHEITRHLPVQSEDGHWRVLGRTYLEDLEDLFDHFDADELPYETVSGLICGHLGYVPKVNETIETQGLVIKVVEADERRVIRAAVRVRDVETKA